MATRFSLYSRKIIFDEFVDFIWFCSFVAFILFINEENLSVCLKMLIQQRRVVIFGWNHNMKEVEIVSKSVGAVVETEQQISEGERERRAFKWGGEKECEDENRTQFVYERDSVCPLHVQSYL